MIPEVSEVTQYEDFTNRIDILFTSNHAKYRCWVMEKEGKWIPRLIAHRNNNCRYCNKPNSWVCQELTDAIENIFKQLIGFPSVRLHWLFLEHD